MPIPGRGRSRGCAATSRGLQPGVPLALAQALQAQAELALTQADFGCARAPLERACELQAQVRVSEPARTRLDGLYGKVLRASASTGPARACALTATPAGAGSRNRAQGISNSFSRNRRATSHCRRTLRSPM